MLGCSVLLGRLDPFKWAVFAESFTEGFAGSFDLVRSGNRKTGGVLIFFFFTAVSLKKNYSSRMFVDE